MDTKIELPGSYFIVSTVPQNFRTPTQPRRLKHRVGFRLNTDLMYLMPALSWSTFLAKHWAAEHKEVCFSLTGGREHVAPKNNRIIK